MTMRWRATMPFLAILVYGCGEAASTDIRVGDGPGSATVSRDPFDLVVDLGDGDTWTGPGTADPALGLISFGVYDGRMNPNRYYDPREPVPGEWLRPGRVRSASFSRGTDDEGAFAGATLDVEVPALVGSGLDVDVEHRCDAAGEGEAPRCRTSVRVAVRDPASIAFTRLSWRLAPDEALYGLGERFDHPDARGRVHDLQMMMADTESGLNEVHVPVPWIVSTRGYAVFIDETRPAAVDLGATGAGIASATFAAQGLTFHVVACTDPWRLAAGITALTGAPRVPPAWAFGPQMWRNVLDSGAELLDDARQIRANDLPVSVLWIDNPWQTAYNDFTFNPLQFPDPEAMIRQLHDAGFKVLAWSTPYLDTSDDSGVREGMNHDTGGLFEEARDNGFLVENAFGSPWMMPWTSDRMGATIDFTDPGARSWWSRTIRRATRLGIDGFKLDYAEMFVEVVGSRLGLRFADGTTEAETHNRHSVLYHRAYRGALADDRPDGFIIGRASTIGGQADVDCLWPGDLDSDFSYPGDPNAEGEAAVGGLPAAVHALQSLAVSGFPTFGSDTGGFRNGAPSSEVLVRWAAHTAFTPVMQIGGGGDSHNPWDRTLYPEDWVLPTMRRFMKLHQQLFPYLYQLVCGAARPDGAPPVLPPGLVWPDDDAARADDCAYLLGPRMLVAAACRGEDPRRVHLPAGAWVDWWTGDVRTGPADFDAANPIDSIPVFLAPGAIVPLLPAEADTMVQTADPSAVFAWDAEGPLVARVAPPAAGSSAEFGAADDPCDGGRIGFRAAVSADADGRCIRFSSLRSRDFAATVLELDWQAFSPSPPGTVAGEGDAYDEAAGAEDVLLGCDDCWFHDEATGKVFASPIPDSVCR